MKKILLIASLIFMVIGICGKNLHEWTEQEILNKALSDSLTMEIHQYSEQEALNLVWSATDSALMVSFKGDSVGILRMDTLIADSAYIGLLEADTAYIGFLEGLNPDRVVTVAKSGGDYTTITTGITAAASERTAGEIWAVLVYPGEYDEAITLSDSIDIVAFNPENTTILRQVTDNNVECHCYLNVNINNGQEDGTHGLYIQHGNSVIEVKGNIYGMGMVTGESGRGIWNASTGTITIIGDIIISENESAVEEGGGAVYNASTGTINVIGNIIGGANINNGGQGVVNGTGTVIVTGNITGGGGSVGGEAVYNASTGTVIVKNGTIKNPVQQVIQ